MTWVGGCNVLMLLGQNKDKPLVCEGPKATGILASTKAIAPDHISATAEPPNMKLRKIKAAGPPTKAKP